MTDKTAATARDHSVVSVRVPAREEFVSVIRMVVTGLAGTAGLGDEDVADLKVAVSEACTNAIRHAYDPDHVGAERTIEVNVDQWDGGVQIDVCDKGGGVAVREASNAPKLDGDEGGFGLILIGSLMDTFELSGNGVSGTRLKFSKLKS